MRVYWEIFKFRQKSHFCPENPSKSKILSVYVYIHEIEPKEPRASEFYFFELYSPLLLSKKISKINTFFFFYKLLSSSDVLYEIKYVFSLKLGLKMSLKLAYLRI